MIVNDFDGTYFIENCCDLTQIFTRLVNSSIKCLYLSNCFLNEKTIQLLQKILQQSQLQKIHFNKNKIHNPTDAKFLIEILSHDNNIRELCIFNTNIYDVTSIIKNNKITKLSIISDDVDSLNVDIDINLIFSTLRDNTSITSFTINTIRINDENVNKIKEMLQKNYTLTTLHIQKCNITDAGLKSLSDAFEINRVLKTFICFSQFMTIYALQQMLEKISNEITILRVGNHNLSPTPKIIELLSNNFSLVDLNCVSGEFIGGDNDIRQLMIRNSECKLHNSLLA